MKAWFSLQHDLKGTGCHNDADDGIVRDDGIVGGDLNAGGDPKVGRLRMPLVRPPLVLLLLFPPNGRHVLLLLLLIVRMASVDDRIHC